MKYLHRRQQGLTITGWIFVIATVLFFVLLGLKMVPSYLQYYTIAQVLESIKQDSGLKQASPREIRSVFNKRIDINGVYNFDRKNLKIDRSKGVTTVTVEYEVREPMAGNVDVVMNFYKQVEL